MFQIMATKKNVKYSYENVTQCPQCWSNLREPTSLPCLHTFCKVCLQKLWKTKRPNATVECPLCRKICTIPTNGVNGFPYNFFIRDLLYLKSSEGRKNACEVCPVQQHAVAPLATTFCVDCSQMLCQRCSVPHKKWSGKPHAVKELAAEPLEKLMPLRGSFCDRHKNELLKLYCIDCKENACLLCWAINHQQHRCQEVEALATRYRDGISDLLDKVENHRRTIEFKEIELANIRQALAKNTQKVEKNIRKKGEEMKQIIDKQVIELLDEVRSEECRNTKAIDECRVRLELAKVSLITFESYARELNDKGKPAQITLSFGDLKNRTNEIRRMDVSLDKCRGCEICFVPMDVSDILESHGTLVGEVASVQQTKQNLQSYEKGMLTNVIVTMRKCVIPKLRQYGQ